MYGFSALMFTMIPAVVTVGFVFVAAMVIGTFVSVARQKRKDDASPVLSVPAVMVTKRLDFRHSHSNNHNHIHTYRHYYATFQVESGDRMELRVQEDTFGLLAEGDKGILTFQGKRFLDFKRDIG